MTSITRLRSDYDARLHVEYDSDVELLDCFLVTLPPYHNEPGVLIYRPGADMNVLWADALAEVARLRAQPWKEILPPHLFQPWGVITAHSYEKVCRETEFRIQMLNARHHPDHMSRVVAASRALDLLSDEPLPRAVPFQLRDLH